MNLELIKNNIIFRLITKKIIIPSEIQGVAGLVSSVTEIAKDVKPTTKANK